MNCKKCNKEIIDTEHYLFNGYCKKCWPTITLNEKKKLEGFCSICGYATWVINHDDSLSCGMCGRAK